MPCDKIAIAACKRENHSVISFMDDAQDIEVQLIDVTTQLSKAAEQREEVQEHLQAKDGKLAAELTLVKAEMKENASCLKKLRETISCCQEMSRLFDANKAARFVWKRLEKTKDEAEGAVQQAELLRNRILPNDGGFLSGSIMFIKHILNFIIFI